MYIYITGLFEFSFLRLEPLPFAPSGRLFFLLLCRKLRISVILSERLAQKTGDVSDLLFLLPPPQ